MLVLAFSFLIVSTTAFIIYKHREIGAMFASAMYELNYNNIGLLGIIADIWNKKKNVLKELPSRKGDFAVVTGGNRGIGAEVVKTLIECQIHVVLGVRDLKRVENMIASLKEKYPEAEISTYELDVSSMKSVRNFAETVKRKHPSINLLINNAGMLRGDYHLTEDGFERQWATNYVGHFFLTHLLMENLQNGGGKGKCSRIVNVSSCMHYGAKLDFEDINMEKWYSPTAGYARSKLAQLMFSRYLNKLLQARGAFVKSYAAHPGLVATDMFFESDGGKSMPWMERFLKSPKDGSTPVSYCCLSSDLEDKGGAYISNGEEGYSSCYSKNEDHQKKLFEITCEMLNIEKFGVV